MAKFKYNGDHANFEIMGLVFRVDGEDLEVETEDSHQIAKLQGNSHFDEIKARKPGRPKAAK